MADRDDLTRALMGASREKPRRSMLEDPENAPPVPTWFPPDDASTVEQFIHYMGLLPPVGLFGASNVANNLASRFMAATKPIQGGARDASTAEQLMRLYPSESAIVGGNPSGRLTKSDHELLASGARRGDPRVEAMLKRDDYWQSSEGLRYRNDVMQLPYGFVDWAQTALSANNSNSRIAPLARRPFEVIE